MREDGLLSPIDRLSALDAAFLDLETPHAPLHVGWTLRFGGAPPSPAALRRHVDGRLDRIPRFRRRLAALPGGPAWVDDPAFHVARHVHHVSLPAPGGPGALREAAGLLLGAPLDHARPLWRLYLVDGVADDGFAIVGQAHHALVDGIAAVEVALLLFDDGRPAAPSRWRPRPEPSGARAAAEAARGRIAGGARAMAGAGALTARPHDGAALVRAGARAVGDALVPAPTTALDRSATHRRVVAFGSAPLEDVRDAGRRRGATVNDVLLAATALALRRALARRDEHPRALKALVPVNIRAGGDAAGLGNAISFTAVALPVDADDPTAVLRAVRDRTRRAKRDGAAEPLGALARAADLVPARTRAALARNAARATSFNAVVSNVPGPPIELSLLGRPLRAVHPAVPLLDGHGLSIGALSYAGRLHLGVYADAEVLPDAVDVARDLESAFDALRLAPARNPGGETPWRARAASRRESAGRRLID